MKNMKILMVCTGNICRSPMAEGIARTLLKAAKRDDISVDSAATHAYHTGDSGINPRAGSRPRRGSGIGPERIA